MAAPKDRSAWPIKVLPKDHDDSSADLAYWLSRTPEERVAAVGLLAEQGWVLQGLKELPRLAREIIIRDLPD